MGSGLTNLKRLLLAIAVTAVVSPTSAQGLARRGQPILLSAPEGDTILTNQRVLTPKTPSLPDFKDTIRVPGLNFNGPANNEPLTPPPTVRMISPAEAARMQALREKNRSWPTMTPAEIWDIPTPEKILGLSESDMDGKSQKKTSVEGNYERQAERQHSKTNTYATGVSQTEPVFFDRPDFHWAPAFLNAPISGSGLPPATDLFSGSAPANNGKPNKFQRAGWFQSVAQPASISLADRQATMDEFQKLLEPHSYPSSATKTASSDKFNSVPMATSDSFFGKNPVNFVGVSASPPITGIGVPTGVAPLRGLLGQTNAPPPMPQSRKPELPPWMSSTPQPGDIPQRKF